MTKLGISYYLYRLVENFQNRWTRLAEIYLGQGRYFRIIINIIYNGRIILFKD